MSARLAADWPSRPGRRPGTSRSTDRRITPVSIAVRGRARLHVHGLRHRPDIAQRIVDGLLRHPAVRDAWASATTGNVLIRFDADRLRLAELDRMLLSHAFGRRTRSGSAPAATDLPWHAITATGTSARLDVEPSRGLDQTEVRRRLETVGANTVPVPPQRSRLAVLAGHLFSVPVLVLVGAAGLAIVSGAFVEAVVIAGAIGVNVAVGYMTERKVEAILASLDRRVAPDALVVRDGVETVVPVSEVVPGDVLVLRAGHDVPADARLIHVDGLVTDEAALTGESVPTTKVSEAALPVATPLAERITMVYAGTSVAEGSGIAIVTGTGRTTELGRVRSLLGETSVHATRLERHLDDAGKTLVVASLASCGLALCLGLARGVPAIEMLRVAISLAVAAVPEGLPAVATTTLALGVAGMARRRVLVRRLFAVEALGATTVICADKTGTLTENRMTVRALHLDGREYEVNGDTTLRDRLHERALTAAILCNEAELDGDDVRGSSTEGALLAAGQLVGIDWRDVRQRYPLVLLKPRINGDHWMGTVHENGAGRFVFVKGAPEQVLARAQHRETLGGLEPLDDASRAAITRANEGMAARGMRVLGLATRRLAPDQPVSWDGLAWLGLVGLTDPVRPGVREAIAACRVAGIRTVILTGDQGGTAAAVGQELGLASDGELRVVDATALSRMDGEMLARSVRDAHVFARVTPTDKHRIVRMLQAAGEVVTMTGDGINDAAALKAADVGVAMGGGGTDLARDVADVVLLDDNFHSIVDAIEQGRAIRDNVDRAVGFLLATNASEILLTLVTLARGRGGMSPIQFLWINLLSDVLPALALALEPPAGDAMRRPPRDPEQPVLSRPALRGLMVDAGALTAASLIAEGLAASRYGAGPRAASVRFSTLAAAQVAYALALRSSPGGDTRSSRLLPAVIGGSLAVQTAAVTLAPLRRLLGTTPIGLVGGAIVSVGSLVPALMRIARGTR